MPPAPAHAIAQVRSLVRDNKPQAALLQLQRLVKKHPDDAHINSMIAGVHLLMGRPDQSLFYAQRAVELDPDSVSNLTNLGVVLLTCGKSAQAIPPLRRSLSLAPHNQETLVALANALTLERQAGEALDHCRAGLALGWHSQLAVTCAGAMLALGDYEHAATFIKDALTKSPGETRLASSLALTMVLLPSGDPKEQSQAHRVAGLLVEQASTPAMGRYTPIKDRQRRLRVALVSPDFRQHSVTYFIEPFLEAYDRSALEVVCYSTNVLTDEVTARLRSRAALWRDAGSLSDAQLAEQVIRDRVDIAIDLAGYTQGHRLGAFAARLAPIQITYLGYPDTTGLVKMDYRIVDSLTDSPGTDDRCTEKLIRLDPCFLCWKPPQESPDPAASHIRHPASDIVFGSFNDARKNNPHLFALWARILAACPGATLALKSMNFGDPTVVQRTLAGLATAGVGSERVQILQPAATVAGHLAQYSQIDIGLDPTPYNGTTTTCEALWMGVPVVTLAGNRHAGRVGVSLLTSAGLPELVANDEDDYVRVATQLAHDPERLSDYRSTLRQRLSASPLCDAASFSRRFESALREAWARWCAA
jgi:predicted O-linked N-acetylglucosamine transferase (SPINDLY family)